MISQGQLDQEAAVLIERAIAFVKEVPKLPEERNLLAYLHIVDVAKANALPSHYQKDVERLRADLDFLHDVYLKGPDPSVVEMSSLVRRFIMDLEEFCQKHGFPPKGSAARQALSDLRYTKEQGVPDNAESLRLLKLSVLILQEWVSAQIGFSNPNPFQPYTLKGKLPMIPVKQQAANLVSEVKDTLTQANEMLKTYSPPTDPAFTEAFKTLTGIAVSDAIIDPTQAKVDKANDALDTVRAWLQQEVHFYRDKNRAKSDDDEEEEEKERVTNIQVRKLVEEATYLLTEVNKIRAGKALPNVVPIQRAFDFIVEVSNGDELYDPTPERVEALRQDMKLLAGWFFKDDDPNTLTLSFILDPERLGEIVKEEQAKIDAEAAMRREAASLLKKVAELTADIERLQVKGAIGYPTEEGPRTAYKLLRTVTRSETVYGLSLVKIETIRENLRVLEAWYEEAVKPSIGLAKKGPEGPKKSIRPVTVHPDDTYYEVLSNTDLNTGGGKEISLGYFVTESAAKGFGAGRGVQGCPADIQKRTGPTVTIGGIVYVIAGVAQREDPETAKKRHVESGLAKLSHEEKIALGVLKPR